MGSALQSSRRPRPAFALIVLAVLACAAGTAATAELEFQYYEAEHSGLAEKSVIILGEREAVLVDGQWLLPDGRALAEQIAATGRRLTHVLITHGHPDHYMGLGPVLERFPQARVLAREAVREEIALEFPAKRIHWQQLMGSGLPIRPVVPEAFEGDAIALEGHEIRWIDMVPAETRAATSFYVPSAKVLIPGDVIFAKMHSYFADLNNPEGWIEALGQLRAAGPIETIYPGHGPVGGPELIDEAIEYMRYYDSVARPGVPLPDIVEAMAAEYPDYEAEILLWWTRGPGFGVFGPRALGVPDHVLAELPGELVYPDSRGSCGAERIALITTLFHEGFTGADLQVLEEVFHPDIRFDDPNFPPGLAGIKALVTKNNESFAGWHFELHDLLCDGNKVTVRWSGHGKHVGSFMGEEPTNEAVELEGISIYQVENGRITADWAMPDNLGFLTQIGVLPSQDMTREP